MIGYMLHAEDLNAAIVRIADERGATIGLRVGLDKFTHSPQPLPAGGRHVLAVEPEELITREKRLQDEAVIGGRLFEIDAVSCRLIEDLLLHDRPSDASPALGASRSPEKAPQE